MGPFRSYTYDKNSVHSLTAGIIAVNKCSLTDAFNKIILSNHLICCCVFGKNDFSN